MPINKEKMGKKSSQTPMKISKHEKKQPLNSLIKILRPKVYITDSSNFKKLVQELTGNGKYSPVESSPPPPSSPQQPPPTWELPFSDHHHHDLSFDSTRFTTPLEGSPDFSLSGSMNSICGLENSILDMDFYKDLEEMFMKMDGDSYDHACNYGMFQQDQIGVHDYDLSSFI